MNEANSRFRLTVVGFVVFALFSALFARLWFLQVGDSQSYGTTYVLWIRARHMSCRKARKKVRAFHACRQGARGRCPNLGRYNCHENREFGQGSFYSTTKCKRGRRVVKHRYNQWT